MVWYFLCWITPSSILRPTRHFRLRPALELFYIFYEKDFFGHLSCFSTIDRNGLIYTEDGWHYWTYIIQVSWQVAWQCFFKIFIPCSHLSRSCEKRKKFPDKWNVSYNISRFGNRESGMGCFNVETNIASSIKVEVHRYNNFPLSYLQNNIIIASLSVVHRKKSQITITKDAA